MLTAHSFCGIPPRHQSLLSGSPIKAEGRLAARALPCLHLVNGRELTPISAERGGGGTQETRTVCVSLALFFFPCSLKHPLPFSSFPWPPFTTPIIPHFLAPSCRARTCQSIRCACETLMQIYTNSAPHMCKEKNKTKNTRPLVSTPTHTLRHQNTRVSSGFMLGAWLPTHTHTHTHTHTELGMLKYDGNLQQGTGTISFSPPPLTSRLCVVCVFVQVRVCPQSLCVYT